MDYIYSIFISSINNLYLRRFFNYNNNTWSACGYFDEGLKLANCWSQLQWYIWDRHLKVRDHFQTLTRFCLIVKENYVCLFVGLFKEHNVFQGLSGVLHKAVFSSAVIQSGFSPKSVVCFEKKNKNLTKMWKSSMGCMLTWAYMCAEVSLAIV